MDNLEKHIRENRRSLDLYEPSPEVWQRIEKQTGKGKKIFTRWMSAAAMIALVLGIGITAYVVALKTRQSIAGGDPKQQELKETELFYNSLVNSLYLEAKPLLTSQPDVERELNHDLARIDSLCTDIRKDLKDNVANKEVIEALIQNYTIKIHILEDMLNVLKENENKTEKGKSNEL